MLLLKSGFVSLSLFDSVFSLRSKLPAERTWRLNFSRDRRWINECEKDRKEGCKKIPLKMWSQRLAQLRSGPPVREYQRGTLWSYWQKLKRLKRTVYPKSNIIANKHYSCFCNAHRLDCSQSLYMWFWVVFEVWGGRRGGGRRLLENLGRVRGVYSDELLRSPITDPGSNGNINAWFKLLSWFEWFSVSDKNSLIWHFTYLYRSGSPSLGLFIVPYFSVWF